MKNLVIFLIFCSSTPVLKAQDSVENICHLCDTTYYHVKKLGQEKVAAYLDRIICYFPDSTGNASAQKCTDTKYNKGILEGSYRAYYQKDSLYLVNFWGKPFKKKNLTEFRKRVFGTEMRYYPVKVKGYYLNGKKHSLWYYYDEHGKLLRMEEYKKGEFIQERIPRRSR